MLGMNIVQIFSGAAVGLIVGLTGVGGGALMTPLLIVLLGVPPLSAVGTDLWFAAITKTVASRWYHQKSLIDWPVVRALWSGSMPASLLTMGIITVGNMHWRTPRLIVQAIGITVLLSGMGLLWQVRRQMLARHIALEPAENKLDSLTSREQRLTIALGVILGFVVTLTSVGAGAIGVVVLTVLYRKRMSVRHLVATDIVHAVPLTAFAGFAHAVAGDIQYSLLANLLLGSVPAVILGSYLATRLPQMWLRLFLCIVLWLTGAKMLA